MIKGIFCRVSPYFDCLWVFVAEFLLLLIPCGMQKYFYEKRDLIAKRNGEAKRIRADVFALWVDKLVS